MSNEAITCQYIFSPVEYRRAMQCYWRYSPLKWWFVVLFLFLSAVALNPYNFPDSSPQETYTASSVLIALVPVIVVFVFVIGLIVLQTKWTFRKGAYFNQEMIYTFQNTGVHLETSRVQTDIKWEVFPRVVENQNGFVLFTMGKRSFNWLPKSGFASPESVAQCRELFRNNVKDSRQLFAS
jgi:hypothetical protein